jgi:cytoskeletal protein CcmA (bactofilin family)
MNMFTRSDKALDQNTQNTSGAMPVRDKAESSAPTATDAKRPYASAQPIADFAAPQARTASVISKALKITGQLESTEDIQVDGEVDGDVRGHAVKIGSNAKVKGSVYGEEVELSGTIEGKIEAKKVVLTSTAHMSGDVIHQDIKIEFGAFIDGHCRPELGKATNKNLRSDPKSVAHE